MHVPPHAIATANSPHVSRHRIARARDAHQHRISIASRRMLRRRKHIAIATQDDDANRDATRPHAIATHRIATATRRDVLSRRHCHNIATEHARIRRTHQDGTIATDFIATHRDGDEAYVPKARAALLHTLLANAKRQTTDKDDKMTDG
ncbi:hypothetical protein NPIL_367251 [Nephila pilipes]|uniref:Uncharacterized protein n=1 Tax=Nephila pilipes TaxID=299642 RepID=A0A8X6J6G0_NEPPI|nr:hypothetical protein NPIL_367251 [Nephila pilipes]